MTEYTKEQLEQIEENGWAPYFVLWVDSVAPGKWKELNEAYNKWEKVHDPHHAPHYINETLGDELAVAWNTYYRLCLS